MPGLLDFLQSPQTAMAAGLLTPTQNSRFGPSLMQGLQAGQQQASALQTQQANQLAIAEAQRQAQQQQAMQQARQGLTGNPGQDLMSLLRAGDDSGIQSMASFYSAIKEKKVNPTVASMALEAAGGDYEKALGFVARVNKSGAATTKIDFNMQKPLGGDAANWTNAEGDNPPATYGVERAVAEGFSPKTTKQLDSIQAGKAATPVIADIVGFGFGVEGEASLFPPKTTGTTERLIGAGKDYLKGLTKSDERISLYNDSKRAFRAGVARLLGHTGVLTAKDVGDATSLIPVPGLTTESQARRQFQQIASLLMGKGVSREDLEELGMPDWAFGDVATDDTLTPEQRALLKKYGG